MPRTVEKTVYTFEELNDSAKEKARNWYRNIALDYEWWAFVYEDAKTIGALMGIDISRIFFTGFYSQGDGACFEGSYSYRKGAVKLVKGHAPKDEELARIVEELQRIQRRNFYQLQAGIKHSGPYYHERCTRIYADRADEKEVSLEDEDALEEVLRDYMLWIYKQLESVHDWLLSDGNVDESIIANEYEFDEEGNRTV